MSSKKRKNKKNKSFKENEIVKQEIVNQDQIHEENAEMTQVVSIINENDTNKEELINNEKKEEIIQEEKIEEKVEDLEDKKEVSNDIREKILENNVIKENVIEDDESDVQRVRAELKKELEEFKEKQVAENNKEDKKKAKKEKKKEKERQKEEAKQESVELSSDNNKLIEKSSTDLLKKEAEYKSNKRKYKLIKWFLLILFVLFISTIFGLIHYNSDKIIGGVKIKGIDISNLTKEEAKEKIEGAIQIELSRDINLHYTDDYEIKFSPKQIDAKYNIEDVIEKASKIGKTGNIVIDNYDILINAIIGRNFKMDLSYNEESLNSIVEDIAIKVPGKVIDYNYSIEEDELIVQNGTKGVEVNKDKLKEEIINVIKNKKIEDVFEGKEETIQILATEREPLPIDIEKIYLEVKCDPVDAHFDLEPYKLYPEQQGIDFKISLDEAKKIVAEPGKEEYKIPLKLIPANKTIKDIGFEAFPYMISKFSTKYDASNINRSNNLKLAADKINGTVLMPGEVFSYNKVVGKRTVEAGYRDAKIYSNGQVVDGLGGGICQISSTLYNAVLMADLKIVERRNHYFKTSYIAAGRDATVVWGSIDFKFENSRTYPVKIGADVSNGVAEFKIYGVQEEEEYEISILPVVTATIPYGTQTIPDPSLAPGQQVVSQSGMSGCKVTTYLEKKLNGKVVSKDAITRDSYNAMNRVVRVGP